MAGTFRLLHRPISNTTELTEALEVLSRNGPTGLIEARVDPEISEGVHLGFWQRVQQETIIPS